MELVKTLLSTATRFAVFQNMEVAHAPEVIESIKSRYRFWVGPKGPKEFDLTAGVKFEYGRFDSVTIDTMQVFWNGMFVQAHARTEIIDSIIDDFSVWVEREFEVGSLASKPVNRTYISALEVRSVIKLNSRFDALNRVADRLSVLMGQYGVSMDRYQVTTIAIQTDPALAKPLTPGRFVFDRRVGIPYSGDIYYSEAPVSTDEHMELLEMLEQSLEGA